MIGSLSTKLSPRQPGSFGASGWIISALVLAAGIFGNVGLLSNMTLWLSSALLALSLQFIWGYGGMLSFCQNAFFGVGAYCFGVASIDISSPGTTVVFVLFSVVGAAVIATAFGYFMFYGRLSDVAVAITTYAFTLTIAALATGVQFTIGKADIGGANGLVAIPGLAVGVGHSPTLLSPMAAFLVTFAIVVVVWLALGRLRASLRGRILDATRQNDERCVLLGYDVRAYRLCAFVVGASVAGLAGGLFAAWAQFVNPGQFSAQSATLVVVWVLVGGRRSPAGSVAGAVLISAAQFYLGGSAAGNQATLILGAIAIVVVLLAPDGLASLGGRLLSRRRSVPARMSPSEADTTPGAVASSVGDVATGHANTDMLASVEKRHGAAEGGDTPLLRVEGAGKSFGGVRAVHDVSLQVARCEVRCIIGANGAGKSTLFNLLVGRAQLDHGSVWLDGEDISSMSTHGRARRGIGVKLQTASIFPELSVRENISLAARSDADRADAETIVDQCLDEVSLGDVCDEVASSLSHGQQQWLELGMVLAQQPKLVLLDEPVAGMTVGEREKTVQMIRRLGTRCGVVVVEHDMTVVERLGGEVTVMHEGSVLRRGHIAELRQDEQVMNAYLGREIRQGHGLPTDQARSR
jgi:branched-chain amino acid transport system permease protein